MKAPILRPFEHCSLPFLFVYLQIACQSNRRIVLMLGHLFIAQKEIGLKKISKYCVILMQSKNVPWFNSVWPGKVW